VLYHFVKLKFVKCYFEFDFSNLFPVNISGYTGKSRLTGSELQGQEEAACTCPAYTTTGVLFTATNAGKFAIAVTRSS